MQMSRYYSVLVALLGAGMLCFAVDYINLDVYSSSVTYQKPQQSVVESLFQEGWNSFKSSVNDVVFADNISTEQFWNALRGSLHDGTFYNKIANAQTVDSQKGADVFLSAVYSSIKQVPVKYMSLAPGGDSITLSGKIFLPPSKNAKNIIIANHYTICANSEAPSEANSIEGIYASKGYIVLMPDYIGYGISADLPHPYMHLHSAVTSALDMLKAAIPYLSANSYTFYKPLILLGYSQGAAVTLALQRELEEKYPDQYSIQKVFAGAGPYNLSGTFDYYTSSRTTDISCTLPMLFIGMNYAENLGLKREDFFTPTLMQKCPIVIERKSMTMNEVNKELGNQIDQLLTPVIYNRDTFPTSVLYEAVGRNNTLNWTPKANLYLFHSTEDNMVPFLNSQTIADEFNKHGLINVHYDFAPYGDHMNGAVTFFEKVYKSL